MRINVGGAMHAKNIQSPMFNDGQIHIAKWVRNALDLNDGDELLFEVVDNKIIFTKAEGWCRQDLCAKLFAGSG